MKSKGQNIDCSFREVDERLSELMVLVCELDNLFPGNPQIHALYDLVVQAKAH